MRPRVTFLLLPVITSALVASCGGNDVSTVRIETVFLLFNYPFESAAAMRSALESQGISVQSMTCGNVTNRNNFDGTPTVFYEATINASDVNKATATAAWRFQVVTPASEALREFQIPCGGF